MFTVVPPHILKLEELVGWGKGGYPLWGAVPIGDAVP
jgi:hypothetical protein